MKNDTKEKISKSLKAFYSKNEELLPFGNKRINPKECYCESCKKKIRTRKRKYNMCKECLNKSDVRKIINAKVSKSCKSGIKAGKNNPMYGKAPQFKSDFKHFSIKLQRNIKCRSSYEVKAFQILDKDKNVLSYEYETLKIPYKRFDINRTLIVDLLIHYKKGKKKIVEVKPKNVFNLWDNKNKFRVAKYYAKRNNLDFEIWSEKQLEI